MRIRILFAAKLIPEVNLYLKLCSSNSEVLIERNKEIKHAITAISHKSIHDFLMELESNVLSKHIKLKVPNELFDSIFTSDKFQYNAYFLIAWDLISEKYVLPRNSKVINMLYKFMAKKLKVQSDDLLTVLKSKIDSEEFNPFELIYPKKFTPVITEFIDKLPINK